MQTFHGPTNACGLIMRILESLIVGVSILLMLISMTNCQGREQISRSDFDTAFSVLRRDISDDARNNFLIFNSLLERTRTLEKRAKVFVRHEYRVMVQGTPK